MVWFLYDKDLYHEKFKGTKIISKSESSMMPFSLINVFFWLTNF